MSAGGVIVNPPRGSRAFVNTGDTDVQLVVIEVEAWGVASDDGYRLGTT